MEFSNLDERFFFKYVIFVVVRVGDKLNRGSDKFIGIRDPVCHIGE